MKDWKKSEQATILNDADIKKVFASFGYKRKDADGAASTRGGGKYDETAILAFLADGEKEQAQLMKKFAVSKQSIGAWGKKLVARKLIKIEIVAAKTFGTRSNL